MGGISDTNVRLFHSVVSLAKNTRKPKVKQETI